MLVVKILAPIVIVVLSVIGVITLDKKEKVAPEPASYFPTALDAPDMSTDDTLSPRPLPGGTPSVEDVVDDDSVVTTQEVQTPVVVSQGDIPVGTETVSKDFSGEEIVNGRNFNTGDIVFSSGKLVLRDRNCGKIGLIDPDILMEILSEEVKFCSIGGKSYRMWNVKILGSGQTGWVAGEFLQKADDKMVSDYEESVTKIIQGVVDEVDKEDDATSQSFAPTGSSSFSPTFFGSGLTDSEENGSFFEQDISLTGEVVTSGDSFGGVVSNIYRCKIPLYHSLIVVSGVDGSIDEFMWVDGSSELIVSGEQIPFSMPNIGMTLLGELDDKAWCFEFGSKSKIKWAGYGTE